MTLTTMTAAAWCASFRSPIYALLVIPLAIAFVAKEGGSIFVSYRLSADELFFQQIALIGIMVADLLALIALGGKLAAFRNMYRDREGGMDSEKPGRFHIHFAARYPTGVLRRRLAIPSPHAPWALAASLAAGLTLFALLYNETSFRADINVAILIAAILPGVSVALIWRERWPTLVRESLYPVSRPRFIREMAAALAVDLAAYWIAISIGAVIPLAILSPEMLHSPLLWAGLISSAFMQALAFGVIAWAMIFRSELILVASLTIFIAWMGFPIQVAAERFPRITPAQLVMISVFTAVVGIACTTVAYRQWRQGNLA